jgi:hypothetical protein
MVQPVPAAAPVYALRPSLTKANRPLDYEGSKSDRETFKAGSSTLPCILKMSVGNEPSNTHMFVKALKGQASSIGAQDIFNTQITVNGVARIINMLTNWPEAELTQVRTEALARRINPVVTSPYYRDAQNSTILADAMQKSLSQEVLQRSLLRWDEYAFPTTLAGGIDQIDAPCFLCVLVSITDTKTRATVYQAFQQLTNLRNIREHSGIRYCRFSRLR